MSDFFNDIVKLEYPQGASVEILRELNDKLNKIEDNIFDKLPWLADESEEKQNSVIVYIYEILHLCQRQ